jgi:hypothetical protein
MQRPRTSGVANALLVIGLAMSVIGLLIAVISPPADPTLSSRPDDRAAPTAVIPESRLDAPLPPFHEQPAMNNRAGHGDARLFLRDAAAAARRRSEAESRRGETRTDLWINNPSSIGSMPRPDEPPATPFALN